jgi:hypothetical protein
MDGELGDSGREYEVYVCLIILLGGRRHTALLPRNAVAVPRCCCGNGRYFQLALLKKVYCNINQTFQHC